MKHRHSVEQIIRILGASPTSREPRQTLRFSERLAPHFMVTRSIRGGSPPAVISALPSVVAVTSRCLQLASCSALLVICWRLPTDACQPSLRDGPVV
jgi:hypothetical protein